MLIIGIKQPSTMSTQLSLPFLIIEKHPDIFIFKTLTFKG